MNRKLAIVIGLQACLIVILFWVLVFYGKDEYEAFTKDSDDQIEAPNRINNKNGMTTITVSPATQTQSDITVTPVKSTSYQTGLSSYGNVMAIDGLLELRGKYMAAKAEADISRAALTRNRSEYSRLHELNLDDKNVSDKAVATALADLKGEETKASAAESTAKNITDSMRQSWGDELTRLAIDSKNNTLLQNLLEYKEVLIQVILPFDAPEPASNSNLNISPTASPSHVIKADFISRSPISNATIQGKTYFYHAKTTDLRAGMQVNAISIKPAANQTNKSGVIIPTSAVVWYGGKPWIYRKTGLDLFYRLPVNTDIEAENGWFYKGNLKPGDQLVTNGAQLLLSEEFKYQITNENDD
ncbi:MAG: hypothetical protein H0W85_06785 [Methylotenera sp.]|nr:hypothetical protein [Methylotenera sp.]